MQIGKPKVSGFPSYYMLLPCQHVTKRNKMAACLQSLIFVGFSVRFHWPVSCRFNVSLDTTKGPFLGISSNVLKYTEKMVDTSVHATIDLCIEQTTNCPRYIRLFIFMHLTLPDIFT